MMSPVRKASNARHEKELYTNQTSILGLQSLGFGGVGGDFIQHHITPPKFNMEPENDCVYNRNFLFQGRKISDEPC